jgi:hypothetical protein
MCFRHFNVGCLADTSEIESLILPSAVSFGAHNCIYNANEFKAYSLDPEDGGNTSLIQMTLRHQTGSSHKMEVTTVATVR